MPHLPLAPVALLALLAALFAGPGGAVETRRVTLVHEGVAREALMDAPRNVRNAPVLVALHGGLAGPRTVRRKARVGLAREGWVVLWPAARAEGDWNDGRTDHAGRPYDTADDIGFLRALIGRLAAAGRIDPSRVYFAGPSIGGMMVLRLLCEAPDLVAGAAVAIASFPWSYACPDGPPRPVLVIHGTDDTIVPPEGGRIGGWNPLIRDRGWVRPIAESLERLAARNRCAGYDVRPLPDRDPADGSTVELRTYRACAAPLLHYVVEGGGHTWPGARPSRLGTRIVGQTNRDFSATEAVERFFRTLAARQGG
ncbi:PHB depolymerase family esterase [Paralimibaculum aggregatum]|uniref:PHB depolymerase family esterase n=1 Tax=Paralimibaculum aggregatum TaxID=3036245 RepID=A0ABQ6LLB5_9RHOB|nr:PHB depolymerase family esterase [Limibaculum sp. NKW23]GMG83094.1 PHB depolymerase family esterase [Limibaculum sp. NKW23]